MSNEQKSDSYIKVHSAQKEGEFPVTDNRSDLYFKVYTAQKGGEFPVHRVSRYIQYGSGFGDIHRSLLRHVLPVVAPTVKTVVDSSVKQIPSIGTGVTRMSGSGKKKRKHKKKKSASKKQSKKKRTSKKKTVYKGKKQKFSISEASSKIPNFNF